MKKLARFTILAVCYIALSVLFYCVIPTISWIFGGEFLAVAQHPLHVLFVGGVILVLLGVIFGECFDNNFCTKD